MTFYHDQVLHCDLCGIPLNRKINWVGLNRWVVSSKRTEMMSEDGSSYVWEPEDSAFTGITLCFPACIMQWLESEVIELGLSKTLNPRQDQNPPQQPESEE